MIRRKSAKIVRSDERPIGGGGGGEKMGSKKIRKMMVMVREENRWKIRVDK